MRSAIPSVFVITAIAAVTVVAAGCTNPGSDVEDSLGSSQSPVTAPDNCAQALDGAYCGYSTMDGFSGHGEAHSIYFCSGHATTRLTHCSIACVIAPPGQPDSCRPCGGTVCGTSCCGAGYSLAKSR